MNTAEHVSAASFCFCFFFLSWDMFRRRRVVTVGTGKERHPINEERRTLNLPTKHLIAPGCLCWGKRRARFVEQPWLGNPSSLKMVQVCCPNQRRSIRLYTAR